MRLLLIFARAYPCQTVMMFIALLFAGAADGISVSALLPLLSVVIKRETGSATHLDATRPEIGRSFEDTATFVLQAVGINPTIGVLLTVIVGAISLKSLLLLLAQKRVGYMVAQVTTDLRLALLRSVLSARWDYFVRQPVGRLANAMASEPMRSSMAYVKGITVVTLLMQTGIYTIVALLVLWKATLASLGSGAAILVASHFLVSMSRRAGKRQTTLMKSMSVRLADTLQSVKPLKAMARGDLADSLLVAEAGKLNQALQKTVFSKAALNTVQEPMFAIVTAAGIFVALVYWHVPLATLLVLVLLLVRILHCLGKVQKEYQKMVTDESAFWSLQQTIEEARQATERSPHGLMIRLEARITLAAIQVAYHGDTVLTNLSLEIPVGSLVALVGPSGAGKTTVVDLLTGLVRPQAGEVYINNVPMAQIDLRHWRHQIGYVPQDNLLLHDTILINVTLGDPALGPTEAEDALRAAGAWEFVTRMPDGMQTLVGERGTRLSGGQRQRIMLARALVHRPTLLILDEATTALDPPTEADICSTLRQLVGDMTILAVSHQAAILDIAERVYRIQDGGAVLLVKRPPQAVTKSTSDLLHSTAQL
ncbi:Vitamin B12 import ATP-binding protein BtuD [Candidatus Entotheonellaceae bacterium PAL068K]